MIKSKRILSTIAILAAAAGVVDSLIKVDTNKMQIVSDAIEGSPDGRAEYEFNRIADPATSEVPSNIRMRELAYASQLPKFGPARDSELSVSFTRIGPYNVGGRTRAFAIDHSNTDVYLAGGVSGGMWKSEDAGESWKRVTAPEDHSAVSCVSQDTRSGKEDVWYYGSGEVSGNSASKSFSAYYRGSGIYKSIDGGESWDLLPSTAALVHKATDWDAVFRVLVNPIRNDSDIVYAAMSEGIMRSNDGGVSWRNSLPANNATFTDLKMTSTGTLYAAISSDGGGNNKGFWRSEDGFVWNEITPDGFPNSFGRTLISIYPGDETRLYFLSVTPGTGTSSNSLWKYRYLSGDGTGTGGIWYDRSSGLPIEDLNLYNGYCQVLAVKPDNEDMVYVGGTNLFRSSNGFADTNATHHIGGYRIEWDTNFAYRSGVHYPDQQNIVFHPDDPDIMISTTDGGVHRTENCGDSGFVWESLSNGYVVAQFYGIAIDHGTPGSEEVMGGLQDRGTFWTNDSDPSTLWTSVRGADGAYCWIEDGGAHQYSSTQYARVRRASINAQGELDEWIKLIPDALQDGGGFLFVHPFTLDPIDNNIMYLPYLGRVWRNDDLEAAENEDLTPWKQISSGSGTITAIAASPSEQGVVYYGTSNSLIYRLDDAHTSGVVNPELISGGISNGGYASCIAIDPYDADRVIVVYSNYNTVSLWLTEDAGENWEPIEGNLVGTTDANVPPQLYYISDGPSTRWAEIAMTDSGYVYFLGTSVGLFSTRELNGDSTIWTQEGTETIGNVVVDMLKYRESDQWLVVGTHGNGIYTGTVGFSNTGDTASGIYSATSNDFTLYPNPANNEVNLSFDSSGDREITVLDELGRAIIRRRTVGYSLHIKLEGLSKGMYFLKSEMDSDVMIKKIIVN